MGSRQGERCISKRTDPEFIGVKSQVQSIDKVGANEKYFEYTIEKDHEIIGNGRLTCPYFFVEDVLKKRIVLFGFVINKVGQKNGRNQVKKIDSFICIDEIGEWHF